MFQSPTRLLSRSLLTVALALAGCGGTQMDDEMPMTDAQSGDDSAQLESAACGNCDNCVLHARCRQPKLPFGLTYWSDKAAIINSQTARAGCVAMIKTSSEYGHAAYVESVSSGTIQLREANWQAGVCSGRSGTKAGLNISGFWCP